MDYLYSIVNLYLKKETDKKKTSLSILKQEESIEFSFNMNEDAEEKTSCSISFDEYRYNIINFINIYKQDLMVIDEKYSYDKQNSTCSYQVVFKNGRIISFQGFSLLETNSVRNVLYGIDINKDELRVSDVVEEKQMAYKPRLRLQQAGFTSYVTLFLTILVLIGILIGVLIIFK